jgi:hypothetical protein
MADLTSIGIALGSLKTIWELAKNAQDATISMKITAEIGNIQAQLIDVQQQTLAIQQDNQKLRGELEKLRSYKHHHSVMWRQRTDGAEDGPFCPICVAEGRELPLATAPGFSQTKDYWILYCPRGHGQPGGRPEKLLPVPGPSYRIPKSLTPEDYFYVHPDPCVG